MLSLLAADELDVAFCLVAGVISEEFAVEPLSREEVVLAYAPDQAPSADRVGVAQLRQRPLVAPRRGSAITSVIERLFADADEPLQLRLESGDPFLLRALAARGFAVAVLPRSLTLLDGPDIEADPSTPGAPAGCPRVAARSRSRLRRARSSGARPVPIARADVSRRSPDPRQPGGLRVHRADLRVPGATGQPSDAGHERDDPGIGPPRPPHRGGPGVRDGHAQRVPG